MGKRGPKPEPTNVKRLHGVRSDRINDDEPIPALSEVSPPPGLSRKARAVWRDLAPDLERKGVLTPWDVHGFATYCDAVVRGRNAREHLDADGEVIETPVFNKNGQLTGHRLVKSPWQLVWKDAAEITARYGSRFGLTPSERQDLSIRDQSPRSHAERLLSHPRPSARERFGARPVDPEAASDQ